MTIEKKLLIATGLCALPLACALADATGVVEGSQLKVIEIQPEASTGLNNIFVVNNTSGCALRFKTANGYTANVLRYSNLGGAYAEEVNDVERETTSVSVPLRKDDMGYILEDGNSRYYCWVTNYANHTMTLNAVSYADEQECDYSVLDIDGSAPAITYYTINGQPRTLGRDIYVDYDTQEFDKELPGFVNTEVRKVYESIPGHQLTVSPPAYCPTYFTVTGDRFLREWGMELVKDTQRTEPTAVACRTEAVQEESGNSEEGSNQMGGETNGLGGSAPANISFLAYTTEGVMHYEWQMSRDQNFENPDYRFYQKDLDYTFLEEGTFYLRFIGSNYDGTCETFGETYTVSIGASALECPNAFSPNDDGVNDIWKVSYRSLIDFHCEIFNRNGQLIYSFDDPSDGWDGKWHGKTVKPGVYYYVIIATGADGQKYKKSGDINIINSVKYGTSTAPIPEE